ncbi:MAG: hypothetical protein EZS28_007694 [Streblomastix strix]|uniref:Uncharacterized protein n=1 Tax=Streblomastix strix TaxID=222440 RepID=A0A5J4WQH6_9EUKA|nr:MAG: hypothetical protein EZS28_007694 [Streblomastix strix]
MDEMIVLDNEMEHLMEHLMDFEVNSEVLSVSTFGSCKDSVQETEATIIIVEIPAVIICFIKMHCVYIRESSSEYT